MGEEEEPQPEMETVVITRAFKAAAAVMGFGCFLLAIVTTGATSWHTIETEDPLIYTTNGLFQKCTVELLPEDDWEDEGHEKFVCSAYENVESWKAACQALMIIVDLVAFATFILLTVGICSAVANLKFTLYKVAILGFLLAVILLVVVLIIYPTMALKGLEGKPFALGWVYVVAWVNTALLFLCALAVIIDKGEELTEREKVPDEEEGEEE